MIEINNQTKKAVDRELIKKIARMFLRRYGLTDKTLSIAIVGDAAIRRLNRKYLDKDETTDVLAFPGENEFFGEIIINYRQVEKQAQDYSVSTAEELGFILVHGLYHLLGHEDKTERGREKMSVLGKDFLSAIKPKARKSADNK